MRPEIEIKGLSYSDRSSHILKNINFSVKKGEFVTLLGANGSGKTSLLKSILGFYRPSSGAVYVSGVKAEGAHVREIRKNIGYMPQSFDVDRNFPMMVRDVIHMGGAGETRVRAAAAGLKIGHIMEKPFGIVSGGEKQKAMLAMVLSRDPGILLLDEPNLNMDMHAYRNFLDLVGKIHSERSLTIIFVTHLLTHIPGRSNRIAAMKNGGIIFSGPKKAVLRRKNIMETIYD